MISSGWGHMTHERSYLEYMAITRQWSNTSRAVDPHEVEKLRKKVETVLNRRNYLSGLRAQEFYDQNPMFEIKGFFDQEEGVMRRVYHEISQLWDENVSRGLRGLHAWRVERHEVQFLFGGRVADGSFITGKLALRPIELDVRRVA